jgi:NodT family efflux transporter outer membrane factor (OMF) lipoprotein
MRATLILAAFLALAACAVGPRYSKPPTVAASPNWVEAASTTAVDPGWWRSLGDPVLSELVQAAIDRNLDLRVAQAQVREARANRAAAFGSRLPQVNATGSANRNELSENGEFPINSIPGFKRRFNLFEADFDASWEIDFWGRNARSVEAADARVASASEALHNVQLETVAEVVRTYVDLRSAQARLASAAQDAQAQTQTAALVGERYQAGEASRLDEARAQAQASSTRSALAGLSADAHGAAYRLALLTARPPEGLAALAEQRASLPAIPPTAGAGMRSDLLRRRPDVRQAERELAAATADVAVATADLFPRVTLKASAGQQSRSTANVFSGSSSLYQFGPSLSWPIFSAGSIRAQIRAAGARGDEAAARYEKAVVSALADSETALNRYAAAGAQRRDRDAGRSQSALALDLAQQRYARGEDDLLTLLDAQSEYSSAEQSALLARASELTALVALYKALGGGWQAADGESS